jgi:hypothetical protein
VLENVLGWFSLILLSLSVIFNIANERAKGGARVLSVLFAIPVIAYVALNLFK